MRKQTARVLTIDMGNTRTKMGLFEAGRIQQSWRMLNASLEEELKKNLSPLSSTEKLVVGWMQVSGGREVPELEAWKRFGANCCFVHIQRHTPLPISSAYQTPESLGIDRLVAVVAAKAHYPSQPVLVIDAGTALTFDVATAAGRYLGGSIAPGIRMRFRALHTFTAKLPLIEEIDAFSLIGNSTRSCILSGVLGGIVAEVEAICGQYQARFGHELKIGLTGGDMEFFENHLKSVTFADANLNLNGIYHILKHNSYV
ncbi:MAG: type III pantothenate kinase [Bacteroidetes bacterium]|nr:MAG: type III pantothenate kinase [Bacteroidota bacterium]